MEKEAEAGSFCKGDIIKLSLLLLRKYKALQRHSEFAEEFRRNRYTPLKEMPSEIGKNTKKLIGF